MRELELLSVVALLEDSKDHKLLRGQVGTIVERLAPGVYEVELAMMRAGLTLPCHCALTSCFSFITSRAIRQLDPFDPHLS